MFHSTISSLFPCLRQSCYLQPILQVRQSKEIFVGAKLNTITIFFYLIKREYYCYIINFTRTKLVPTFFHVYIDFELNFLAHFFILCIHLSERSKTHSHIYNCNLWLCSKKIYLLSLYLCAVLVIWIKNWAMASKFWPLFLLKYALIVNNFLH